MQLALIVLTLLGKNLMMPHELLGEPYTWPGSDVWYEYVSVHPHGSEVPGDLLGSLDILGGVGGIDEGETARVLF